MKYNSAGKQILQTIYRMKYETEYTHTHIYMSFQVALVVKNLPASAGDVRCAGLICGQENPLEEGRATQSSILAWRIPMDRGAWRTTVLRVAQTQTQLR